MNLVMDDIIATDCESSTKCWLLALAIHNQEVTLDSDIITLYDNQFDWKLFFSEYSHVIQLDERSIIELQLRGHLLNDMNDYNDLDDDE